MKTASIHIVILILILSWTLLFAQDEDDIDLRLINLDHVKKIERDMGADDIHRYRIELETDQFFSARIEQKGIDVLIRIIGPEGEQIKEIDSPTGTRGTEFILLTTKSSGEYIIEIHPFDPLAQPGHYIFYIEKLTAAVETIEEKIDQLFIPWDKKDSPGAAIAVVKDGKVIYKKGYGLANLEYDIPITPKTVFHMASVSKQFTAFSIAALAQEGKISLNDDIRKYLPEVPDFGKTITINHLVHHTSGLRDQWSLLMLAGWRLDDVITKDQILKMVSRQKELNFNPGDEYLYCNTGYTLMAEIVARVSGKSFPQWTKENVFDPLDMKHTLFYDDHEKIVPNRAYSYHTDDSSGYKKSVLSYANVGATSLFTTAEDLSKWAINFDQHVIGNPALFAQMEERGILNNGDTIAYAFGQGVGKYKGLKIISHSGGDAGYRTYLGRFPDQKFSVMVLSNLGSFDPSGMAMNIAELYLADLFVEEAVAAETEPEFETINIAPVILQNYAGEYELISGERIAVRRNGDKLNIRLPGQAWETIYAVEEAKFLSFDGKSKCFFQINSNGDADEILIDHQNQEIVAKRLIPLELSPEQLIAYTGSYYSDELATTYTLILQDSVLIMRHQRHPDYMLRVETEETFSGVDFYGQLIFERNQQNQITGFKLNMGRVRNLQFYKGSFISDKFSER